VYGCLWRRADALFETVDAVLTAGPVPSLPYLSLEPVLRRGHGMICQGLARGRVDDEALRGLLVAWRPRDWPLVFAVGAPTYPRPWAATSPGREWHHHACPGSHGSGGAAVAGWAFQWLAQLSFDPDSWTAPQDQVRVGAGDDATRQAARQIRAHAARLRADGETRIPLYVLDAGYDEAPLTWDLGDHLDQVQILVRLRNDRVLYRDPPPRVPHQAGRPRIHGSGADRFACKNPAIWGPPGQELALHDDRYGQVRVMSWSGLHPKLFCRGRFAGFAEPPVIRCHLIRVTVTHPEQAARWTWLIIAAITQLRLARALAEDHRLPWERRRRADRLTPGRVRRDFDRLLALVGTPASPPKPSRAGPGRPRGRTSTPAQRHAVTKKAA
jgi:hypothetical protein